MAGAAVFGAVDVEAGVLARLLHTADDTITPTQESICLFGKAGMPTELALLTGTSHFPLSPADAPRTKVVVRSWLDKFFPLRVGS